MEKKKTGNLRLWEVLFHLVLLSVVFVFYVFGKKDNLIEAHEVAFFLNYAIAAYLINFLLLPLLLYKKRYLIFVISILTLISIVIFIEEGVIEQVFFPDTRGKSFPGIFPNLLSALPTITILAGFKFAWDALTSQRKVEELQLSIQESELQYLKSQINPHFLFNNLNNLYSYALEESKKTPEIILELSGVLRYMLYECQEKYVLLNKEIKHLENFINLTKLQLEERGKVTFSSTASVGENWQIAPLILSVFVENAFKHSLSSQSEDIEIDIHLDITESGQLTFKCKNTFSNQSNTNSLSKGIGLANVKKRLNLIYPKGHRLDITTKNETYCVELFLELKTVTQ